MLSQFLEEYEKAVDELTSISADPVLKGSYLHEKISELKSTVKRKYGAKVSPCDLIVRGLELKSFILRFKSFKRSASINAAEPIFQVLPRRSSANG
jgi:hypothetical protein